MGFLFKLTSVAVVLSAVGLGWLNKGGVTDGTVPLFHLLDSHGFSDADMPDLTGKTALVTGASSGLGLGVARSLARHGASVTVTARSPQKCADTLQDIQSQAPNNDHVQCEVVELNSLKQTRTASAEIATKIPKLDMLVLNAGMMFPPTLMLSEDGVEQQFQVNHLAQFQLLQILLPCLKASSVPRVVFVSSVAHYFPPTQQPLLSVELLNDSESYTPDRWYGWSKLCNLLTARELNRREPQIVAHAVHPGGVQGKLLRYTNLSDNTVRTFERYMYWDKDTAALTVLRPLVSDEYAAKGGKYFVPIAREAQSSKLGENKELGQQVWDFSESLLTKL